MHHEENSEGASRWALRAGCVVAALSFLTLLGSSALIDPDEGRNALIAREMADGGSWLVPTMNGLPFLDKPFLYFASVAAFVEVLGPSEWAVRLPSVLCGWATVLLVALFARRLYGREAFAVAALACATLPMVFAFSRLVILDPLLSVLVQLALVSWYVAMTGRRDRAQLFSGIGWSAVGLGILVKGPIALILPLLVAVSFGLLRGGTRRLFGWSALVLPAMLVPWLLLVEARQPGFLHYALVVETWGRFTTDELRRSGPLWYFVPLAIGGGLPWSLMALRWVAGRIRSRERLADGTLFVVLWMVVPFLFFSLSESKRPQYLLPLLPALAILVARAWLETRRRTSLVRWGAGGLGILGVVLLVAANGPFEWDLEVDAETTAATLFAASILGALSLASALAALASARFVKGSAPPLLALSAPVVCLPLVLAPALGPLAEIRSSRSLVKALEASVTPETQLLGIDTFRPSFAFYAGRQLRVASELGQPFRVNSVEHFFEDLLLSHPDAAVEMDRWRDLLSPSAVPRVAILDRRHELERQALEAAGYELIADDWFTLAYGRGVSKAPQGDPAPIGGGRERSQ